MYLMVDAVNIFNKLFQVFTFDEKDHIVESNNVKYDDIVDFSLNKAINENIQKIVLIGNKEYVTNFQEKMNKKLQTEYTNNNIEIEVIE